MDNRRKIVGVLGGMGPYATLAFYQKVLDLTQAQKDSDHIRMIIDNNTHIPSRNRHLIYGEASPVEAMLDAILGLQDLAVDAVYIPCNSASHFINPLQEKVSVPIFSPIEITLEHILQHRNRYTKIAIWGAQLVYQKRLYQSRLNTNKIECLEHSCAMQSAIEDLIYSIKQNRIDDYLINKTMKLLKDVPTNIDTLVLGCTELALVFDQLKINDLAIVDSNHLLAQHLVMRYKNT